MALTVIPTIKIELNHYSLGNMNWQQGDMLYLPYRKAFATQSLLQETIYQVECSMLAPVLYMLDPKRLQSPAIQ